MKCYAVERGLPNGSRYSWKCSGRGRGGFDLKQTVLLNGTFGPREVEHIVQSIARDFSQYRVLRDAVAELAAREDQSPASRVRLGVCLYLLGRYYRAIEVLKQGDGGALAHFYLAKCHFARQQYHEAARELLGGREGRLRRRRVRAGPGRGAPLRRQARPRPWRMLDASPARSSRRPSTSTSAAPRWPPWAAIPSEVVALYERAVEADRNHPGALFGLALENDRRGNDDTAMELYKRSAAPFPAARRLAAEPRPAVRGPRAVRSGRPVLPAGPGRVSRPSPGRLCSSRTPRPRASSTTTRTPRRSATA